MSESYCHLESSEEFTQILSDSAKNNGLVVVDFFTTWCGPCKQLAPVFAKVAKDMATENVTFVKVDVEQHDELGEKYGIASIPTLKYFIDCACVDTDQGFKDEQFLKKKVNEYLNALKDLDEDDNLNNQDQEESTSL